ncbi:8399_t:CDS:2 [Entrophospora sp. SA101]|nr:8399_t:CDS:2 [Entrophospora sp. SA101]
MKKHKFDGILKAIKTKRNNQVIIIIEFSKGRKATPKKRDEDYVKLCRNAMRVLNELLKNIPKEKAKIYFIQSVNGYIKIKYLIQPLPSIYLLNQFLSMKIPVCFEDFEDFAESMVQLMNFQADVLLTTKRINKAIHTKEDNHIFITSVDDTPEKMSEEKVNNLLKTRHTCPKSPTPAPIDVTSLPLLEKDSFKV